MPAKTRIRKLKPIVVPMERIERRIHLIRGQKVMLDADLAELYRVETRTLNQAVKRNLERFPEDFMFALTAEEAAGLRSQVVILEKGRGRYTKYTPIAFTEHGVAMLSSVLRSKTAVQMNIFIVRAFVKLREFLITHGNLGSRMEKIEAAQKEQASVIGILAGEIEVMRRPPNPPRRRIGFKVAAQ